MGAHCPNIWALGWVRLDHGPNQILHHTTDLVVHLLCKMVVLGQLFAKHHTTALSTVERILLVDHDEQHQAQTPDINLKRVVRSSLNDLGRIVGRSTTEGLRERIILRHETRETKVGHDRIIVGVQQNIGQFEVTGGWR